MAGRSIRTGRSRHSSLLKFVRKTPLDNKGQQERMLVKCQIMAPAQSIPMKVI